MRSPMAGKIARKSPRAICAAKRLIDLSEHSDAREVLLAESREQAALIGTPEQMEVIAAEFGKREPKFK